MAIVIINDTFKTIYIITLDLTITRYLFVWVN